jgi:hypothetical protein
LLAQAAGADHINMTMIPICIRVPSGLVEDTIVVNALGERFDDETGPYFARVEALQRQPGGTGFYLFDAQTAEAKATLVAGLPGPVHTADDLTQVAEAIGADPGVLRGTLVA